MYKKINISPIELFIDKCYKIIAIFYMLEHLISVIR